MFATCIGPEVFTAIQPISDTPTTQANPVAAASGEATHFFWLAKDDTHRRIMTRPHVGDFGEEDVLIEIPDRARCGHLDAVTDGSGVVWLAYTQMHSGQGAIQVLRLEPGAKPIVHTVRADTRHNQRPALAPMPDGGVWVVWDSFCDGSYDIYGCLVDSDGPTPVERVSQTLRWNTIPAVTVDASGRPWAGWIARQDVVNDDFVFDQAFSIECARWEESGWAAVPDSDGGSACADLRSGLLLGEPRGYYHSYRGRRRKPMLRTAADGSVWLLWERKAQHNGDTASTTGLLLGRCFRDGAWSELETMATDKVFYEVETGGVLPSPEFCYVGRDVISEDLFFGTCDPSSGPPEESIDWSEWRAADPPAIIDQRYPDASNVTDGPLHLCWADLHNHSAVSIPPEGEPDELLMYAREMSLLGACAVTDNDHCWGGRTYTEYDWDLLKGWVDVFNEADRFVVLPGYEFSYRGTEMHTPFNVMLQGRADRYCDLGKGIHHRSVYSDDDDMEMLRWRDAGDDPMANVLEFVRQRDYFMHPHHGTWTLLDAEVETNVEVCSGWSVFIDKENTYRKTLEAGHHVGFVANSDGHRRVPGLGGGVTGIWAERLDRPGIIDALRKHRCFATAGERIVLLLKVNDARMGETIALKGAPRIAVRIHGVAEQDYRAVLLCDESAILERTFRGTLELEHEDAGVEPGEHSYRVEIHGADSPEYPGNIAPAFRPRAWSSPIWVEVRADG